MIVLLKAKTLKGRNVIKNQGTLFIVRKIVDGVSFKTTAPSWSPNEWLLIESVDKPSEIHTRWVHLSKDPNFIVEVC